MSDKIYTADEFRKMIMDGNAPGTSVKSRRCHGNGEAMLQEQCVRWFRYVYPGRLIFAIPNGGSRNILEAANLKRQGVVAGVPDLFIACPSKEYSGLFIEMKYGRNKTTDNQEKVMSILRKEGYLCEVCYTFDRFKEIVGKYF